MIHGHAECLARSLKRICYHRWQKICGNSQLTSIRTIHQHFIGNVLSFPPTDKSYRYPPAPLEAQVPDDLQQPHKPSHIGRHMNIDRQDTFRTSHHGVVAAEVSATDRDIGRIRLRTDIGRWRLGTLHHVVRRRKDLFERVRRMICEVRPSSG